MKQIELDLNKRLLVVEYETEEMKTAIEFATSGATHKINNQKVKFICKGSELTEDIAKGFLHQSIHTKLFAHYVKGIPVNTYCYKSYLDSFISAIESKGYHWGENPIEKPIKDQTHCAKWQKKAFNQKFDKYKEAESRTFNPEKTLIFEII
ncbi:hypothetical protein EG359_17340 [Chryseobacterium joostei]|uniref:Uncharacterized protein n=1 Tax=Chryseobacterium joostei TaxID=112234 RepID=A0A1N7IAZ9_9FLAO|nr:hypothetical protein [Chryseobacterium joostei]AZB01268.1 hypothetical protein EG359_17340 [Chryseobacterium joostei]SIS34254.1 hypothetical protein SAMN05421768_103667 [Chryseobacterium joostei]